MGSPGTGGVSFRRPLQGVEGLEAAPCISCSLSSHVAPLSIRGSYVASGACKLPLLSLSCWFAVHSPPGLADLLSPCLPHPSQPNASSESHGLLAASLLHPNIPQTPQRLLTLAPPKSAGDSSACHPDNSAIVLSSTLATEACLVFV